MLYRGQTWVIGLLALFTLAGCKTTSVHTAGRNFDYHRVNELKLGVTTPDSARVQFGQPKAEKTVTNDFNDYSLFQYIFVEVNAYSGKEDYRILTLEFVDETLNGYIYGSSYVDDLGPRNLDGKSRINRQASVGADVIREMGQPDGKAYYNTTLEIFAEGSGDEIWVYDEQTNTEGNGLIMEKTLVGFDRDGVVDNVTTSKTKIN